MGNVGIGLTSLFAVLLIWQTNPSVLKPVPQPTVFPTVSEINYLDASGTPHVARLGAADSYIFN